MKKRKIPKFIVFVLLCARVVFLCGLTVLASSEIFPAEVQTVTTDSGQQIIKTYILSAEQSPADIPREGFERDGWSYELTDITESKTSETDTKNYTEIVTLNTDTKDLQKILPLLLPTLETETTDGYSGILTLDMSTVKCEVAGYKSSSYTLSATREYPNMPTNDTSQIPKTITENDKTLTLAGVTWEAENNANIDFSATPASYKAIAQYTGSATKSSVIGYVTTAEYTGEVAKTTIGESVYTAYFAGSQLMPLSPEPTVTPETSVMLERKPLTIPPKLLIVAGIVLLFGGFAAFWLLRNNTKIYTVSDGSRTLAARAKLNTKNTSIDLSALGEYSLFVVEIEKLSAKSLNNQSIELRKNSAELSHKIAFEGNVYRIEADFCTSLIKAIY